MRFGICAQWRILDYMIKLGINICGCGKVKCGVYAEISQPVKIEMDIMSVAIA